MRIVIALLLTACSAAPRVCTPGESRACVCTSGVVGAQVCDALGAALGACRCEAVDGGTPIDAASDPGDAGVDAGFDAALVRDGGVDASAVDAPADAGSPWACDVLSGSGCASGFRCRLAFVGGRSPANGPPECVRRVPNDDGREDESCETLINGDGARTDDCGPGMFCRSTCRRYCLPDVVPCPDLRGSPRTCETVGSLIDPNPMGLGLCTF